MERILLITVGTTSFPDLINQIGSKSFLQACEEVNITKMIVQHGRGAKLQNTTNKNIIIEQLEFTDDLRTLMQSADLVLGHAGAGTILDALGLDKPLIVIANNTLMNNHQEELAEELAIRGHLIYVKGGPQNFFLA